MLSLSLDLKFTSPVTFDLSIRLSWIFLNLIVQAKSTLVPNYSKIEEVEVLFYTFFVWSVLELQWYVLILLQAMLYVRRYNIFLFAIRLKFNWMFIIFSNCKIVYILQNRYMHGNTRLIAAFPVVARVVRVYAVIVKENMDPRQDKLSFKTAAPLSFPLLSHRHACQRSTTIPQRRTPWSSAAGGSTTTCSTYRRRWTAFSPGGTGGKGCGDVV